MGMMKWWNGSEWVRRVMKYNDSGWVAREMRYPPAVYDGSTVAWYDYKVGVTKDGSNYVSSWADKLGSGHDLLQATGTNQPLWTDDGILFDGVDNFLKTTAFTWNQPETIYIVFKQVTWTVNDAIFDGDSANSSLFLQIVETPKLCLYAGSFDIYNANLALDTYGIIKVVFNGVSSKIQVDDNISIIGNPGTSNAGGFTLGGYGGVGAYSNIQVKEIICRNVADTAQDEEEIYQYLADKYNPLLDGSTVAWFDAQDLKNIQKDGSNYVSVWGDRSQGGVSNLGAELVVNGGFDSGTGWSVNVNWAISGGTINYDDVGNDYFTPSTSVTFTAGKMYRVKLNISSLSSDYARIFFADQDANGLFVEMTAYSYLSNGNYEFWYTCANTATNFRIYGNTGSGSSFSLDNLSIREIPGNHLVQATGTNQPLWSADGITFDGVDNFMKTAAFTWNQPETIYIVFKQVTWTNGDYILDGNVDNVGYLRQYSISASLELYAGLPLSLNSDLSVNTFGIVKLVLNGVSSKIQVDDSIAITGNVGSSNMGGFTLGRPGAFNDLYSNIQVKEIICRNVADTASDEAKIYAYLSAKYSIT